jgi:aspartyl-tRNA(Asn)/glutamyl-tRNA(Gln) amidotransferase subunit C
VSEITPDVVRHLAHLARIDVTDAEVDRFAEQLGLIVDSAATLKAAVAGDVPATSHPIPMTNVYRDDVVIPSLTQEQALSGSADSESGRFRVAAILDEE